MRKFDLRVIVSDADEDGFYTWTLFSDNTWLESGVETTEAAALDAATDNIAFRLANNNV